jgi:ATP-binding cassette subfamily B (MDR/TAP) protein 1
MKDQVEPAGFMDLFRFADKIDIALMVLGTALALGSGVSLIFYAIPFGNLVKAFSSTDTQQIVADTLESVYSFLYNSIVVFVIAWFSTSVWTVTS